jgi:hypothetical protein
VPGDLRQLVRACELRKGRRGGDWSYRIVGRTIWGAEVEATLWNCAARWRPDIFVESRPHGTTKSADKLRISNCTTVLGRIRAVVVLCIVVLASLRSAYAGVLDVVAMD